MLSRRHCFAIFAVVLGGCAAQPEVEAAVDIAGLEGREATLRFTADWQTEVVGELVAGGIAHLDYDPARARCTTSRYGNPAWTVSAYYRIDGGEIRTVHAAGHAPAPDQIGVPIELTQAGELEIWFENTDVSGCQEWDSAFGANHRFTIAPAPGGAVARFLADGTTEIEGEVRVGSALEIEFAETRLPTCRDTRYGIPAWNILAHYRFPSGRTGYVPVWTTGRAQDAAIDLSEAGELQIWFEAQGYYGCREWDSRDGENHRVVVDADPRAPGWIGNAQFVISRMTCEGGPCERDLRPLDAGWSYDTYARQRAAIRAIYFDVWKAGVTDWDNPDLWEQLDVQVHFRARAGAPFETRYVPFHRRSGNDARYQLAMAEMDPLAGPYTRTDPSQCPDADLFLSSDPDSVYVYAIVEYYFTVNGVPLRRADGASFRGTFEDYRSQFDVCLPAR
ncbi:MAG: DUF6209 family protein [Myxococcota bacterium]|nr:DUF6209 family protein [Myxococcota bacterium]